MCMAGAEGQRNSDVERQAGEGLHEGDASFLRKTMNEETFVKTSERLNTEERQREILRGGWGGVIGSEARKCGGGKRREETNDIEGRPNVHGTKRRE